LQTAWEKKRESAEFALYKNTLTDGLEKIKKYYTRFDEKLSYILRLGIVLAFTWTAVTLNNIDSPSSIL
jgi:hypothetical protein